jgi:peptidyl-prolyl cis-trans isomerase SurA
MTDRWFGPCRLAGRWLCVMAGVLALPLSAGAQDLRATTQLSRPAAAVSASPTVDYVVALVNSQPITNVDVRQRLLRTEQQMTIRGEALPARDVLLPQVLEQLVSDRALLQLAAEMGIRVDDASLTQAEEDLAAQNQLTLDAFRRRLVSEGLDPARLRSEMREQMLLQRLTEREAETRVRVTEQDIDDYLRTREITKPDLLEINLGHVLIKVPEGASADQVQALQARAHAAADRLKGGAEFEALARSTSEAPEAQGGGQLGMRALARLPELFVNATRSLPEGGIAGPLRSPAGFHVLKVLERREVKAAFNASVTESRARHILLRPGPQLSGQAAAAQLERYSEQIRAGQATFERLAREHSQDGSAAQGGDLGWVRPGQFVPEFESVMNALKPGEMSPPVVSRFGVHLIRLDERRQVSLTQREQREVVREQLRQKKSQEALRAWIEEVRGRAFVEYREAPQL